MISELLMLSAALFGREGPDLPIESTTAAQLLSRSLTEHKSEIISSHNAASIEQWEAPEHVTCNPVLQGDQTIGFSADFGSHVFSFDLKGFEMGENTIEQNVHSGSSFPGLLALSALEKANGFALKSCVAGIPSLRQACPSSTLGDWTIVSFGETGSDCAQVASTDLLFTYQSSSRGNFTKGKTEETIRRELSTLQGTTDEGTLFPLFLSGFNQWAAPKCFLYESAFDGSRPAICSYQNPDPSQAGHIAMKIGEAETAAFWNFKTSYDIVASSLPNVMFSDANSVVISPSAERCFFGVKSTLRQRTVILGTC